MAKETVRLKKSQELRKVRLKLFVGDKNASFGVTHVNELNSLVYGLGMGKADSSLHQEKHPGDT